MTTPTMTATELVDDLTYVNYRYNRQRSPQITPARWAKLYGPQTMVMERRYQREGAAWN